MLHEEKLSAEKHIRSVGDFCCGADSPLDTFLNTDAFKYNDQRYGLTYILTASEEDENILGFYTLKTSGIQVEENGEYNSIPAIEIARIAMSYPIQGQGIGKYVFYTYILPKILKVASIVAVKAIIAFGEPDDEQATSFYTSIGFKKATEDVQKEIEDSFNEKCDLYIVSIDSIEAKTFE